MQHIFSTGQVAQMLGLKSHQIQYAHTSGQLTEPRCRFLGKRAYRPDDLRRVAKHFGLALDDDLKLAASPMEGA
jgi:DNA-binding transcriptional MerR regulator